MLKKKYTAFLIVISLFTVTVATGCGNMDNMNKNTASSSSNKSSECGNKDSCKMDNKNTSDSKMDSDVDPSVDEIEDTNGEVTLDGWLYDYMSRGSKTPESKTKECLIMPKMEQSGYGVLVKQEDKSYKFYKFDDNGQKLSKNNILAKTKKSKGITIEVKGTVKDKILKVTAITEK